MSFENPAQATEFGCAFGTVPAFVRARLQQRLLALCVCLLVAGMASAAGGAESSPSSLNQRANALRQQNVSLATRSHEALIELYALDAQLTRTEARIDALHAQTARIRSERASVHRQLVAARSSLHISQRRLARRLGALYERGNTDPLAVVLGATSLDEALTGLDDLNRSAALDKRVAAQLQRARASLARLSHTLAARDAQVRSLTAAAESSLASLIATRAERQLYIESLAGQRQMQAAEIARLESRAKVSVARTQALSPPPTSSAQTVRVVPPEAATAVTTAHTMTVIATGYALSGATATGLPAGWGIVAVDPSVIPLGTRMTIPGYGEGVAADTGSAIQGGVIDLWFPSDAQAMGWGRRIVTITLH